jgi:RecA/RadA recombinase
MLSVCSVLCLTFACVSGEMAFNVMDELVRSGVVDIIVVDSVSALVPRSEVEGDIGTPQVRGNGCNAGSREVAAGK